jgi:hypothetical protein
VESGQATFSILDLDIQSFDSDTKSEGMIGICSTLFIGYQTVTVPREFDRQDLHRHLRKPLFDEIEMP